MKISTVDDQHVLCLSSEEASLLVDLCHAGAFSDHIAPSRDRRERLDAFLWQVQQSLLPAVQQRHSRGNRGRRRVP